MDQQGVPLPVTIIVVVFVMVIVGGTVISLLRGRVIPRQFRQLAAEHDWEFRAPDPDDDLISPLNTLPTLSQVRSGDAKRHKIEAAIEMTGRPGSLCRTFDTYALRPSRQVFVVRGHVGSHPIRIGQYERTEPSNGRWEVSTCVILDLGHGWTLPWMRARSPEFFDRLSGREGGYVKARGGTWIVESRNEAVAQILFDDREVDSLLQATPHVEQVEIGYHWIFLKCGQISATDAMEVLQGGIAIARALPEEVVRKCRDNPREISRDQYDYVLRSAPTGVTPRDGAFYMRGNEPD